MKNSALQKYGLSWILGKVKTKEGKRVITRQFLEGV